ncbi:MAG: ankyrin repeat domain-containing protein, partial [Blastocatellia bacterium]
VTSQMPPIGPGMTSGKSFVTLHPNASFETKTSVVILLTRQDNQVDETTLPPGDYFLQVTVRTWPESHALPVKLSRAWSGNGAFWYSNVTCQPVRLNIAENPYNEDCSAFGDLLREGLANPNATDLSGNTVLMAAVYQDEKETFLELLKKGANVNAKTQNGFTTLILAAGRGNFDAVVELLSRGADPNAKTDEGETALLQALSKCEPEIVKALIDAGADVNIRNRNGKSTLSLAESCSHDERSRIIGLLKKAGAR